MDDATAIRGFECLPHRLPMKFDEPYLKVKVKVKASGRAFMPDKG